MANFLRQTNPMSCLHRVVEHGSPAAIMAKHVSKQSPDLVVTGTHGRTGVQRAVGSIAEMLLRSLLRDILSVRATSPAGTASHPACRTVRWRSMSSAVTGQQGATIPLKKPLVTELTPACDRALDLAKSD
ncbi:MAG: universal stress protein [Hyphomicrobiaceae bacterium]